ncbi:UNVERIFIED_CONTAM: hypothetical protein Sindi_1777300 [Sesamum indicum]
MNYSMKEKEKIYEYEAALGRQRGGSGAGSSIPETRPRPAPPRPEWKQQQPFQKYRPRKSDKHLKLRFSTPSLKSQLEELGKNEAAQLARGQATRQLMSESFLK